MVTAGGVCRICVEKKLKEKELLMLKKMIKIMKKYLIG